MEKEKRKRKTFCKPLGDGFLCFTKVEPKFTAPSGFIAFIINKEKKKKTPTKEKSEKIKNKNKGEKN